MEYVFEYARHLTMIRYAVATGGSKYVEYDLDQEDVAESCNAVGIDLTTVAEAVAEITR